MFGSLIEQAMKGAQGGGAGQSPAGQAPERRGVARRPRPAPRVSSRGATRAHPVRTASRTPRRRGSTRMSSDEPQREEREPLPRADDRPVASGPEESRPGAGPVPVTPPEQPRHASDDDPPQAIAPTRRPPGASVPVRRGATGGMRACPGS